mmetsp:Transcript_15473/g.30867  ORF Transcript_15473/g.30867 Transcript_15473/m.30867 type:complete len:142 (+) Transcript_15473:3971-4396(+)
MTAMRSERMSASSMKWVVRRVTRPFFLLRRSSQVARREYGSMPEVGSSRRRNLGSPQRATATLSFLFIPPESAPLSVSSLSARPTSAAALATSAAVGDLDLMRLKKMMCSRTVSSWKSTLCWGQMPIECLALSKSVVILLP